eukprot:11321193-Alexandrium_andersonii.AAC.1
MAAGHFSGRRQFRCLCTLPVGAFYHPQCYHPPQVEPTKYPNNTLANIEECPTFHMDEAAAPAGPTGRIAL